MTALEILHAISGLIVLSEALRCLERARPAGGGLDWRRRAAHAVAVLAWLTLAASAGFALFLPLLSALGPPICWAGLTIEFGQPSWPSFLLLLGAAGVVLHGWLERLTPKAGKV